MLTLNKDSDYELSEVLEQFRQDGSLIKGKARVLAEVFLDKLYPRMIDPDISTNTLLDVGKVLIELGDLKPKAQAVTGNVGPNFSISINIPQPDGAPPIVITGHAVDVDEEIEGDAPSTSLPSYRSNTDLMEE